MKVGDFVRQGTCIGEVDFRGLPHLHLAKVFSKENYWGEWHYVCMPDTHFVYSDEEPPVIKTPFYFFKNDSSSMIQPDAFGKVVLSGGVDIVVGIRDGGSYAASKQNGFGDRLAVAKIDYDISSISEREDVKHRFRSFDFREMKIKKSTTNRRYNTELTRIVYKHWRLFEADRPIWNKAFSYYVITNCPGQGSHRELTPSDREFCWSTGSLDEQGRYIFPDGEYDITVTASDWTGNKSTKAMRITVANATSE